VRAVRCRGRLVDFRGNSCLLCQTDCLEDTRPLELEGLGKIRINLHSKKKETRIMQVIANL